MRRALERIERNQVDLALALREAEKVVKEMRKPDAHPR